MASISKALAEQLIAQDGYYSDDPRAEQIIKYDNAFGGVGYAVLYKQDVAMDRYRESYYIRNPQILWSAR